MRNSRQFPGEFTVKVLTASRLSCLLAVGVLLSLSTGTAGAAGGISRWKLFAPVSTEQVDTNPHPAVVRVIVDEGRLTANGTGSLVGLREQHGLVVTNWHVIREAKGTIRVIFPDGFRSEATVLKTDQDWDLAALLIWRPNVAPISICSTAPQPGDLLKIAGYGPGDYRAVTGKCTQYLAPSVKHPYELVEVSVAARQGDSGGPILNDRNELAGVLFGADRGTTTGSYGGRVRWFLSSVWPEFQASTRTQPTSNPLVGFQVEESTTTDSAPPRNLVPIRPLESTAESSIQFDPDPAHPADVAFSSSGSSLPPLPVSSSNSNWNWLEVVGGTRWDQAKSLLAVLGLLALWGHLSRWMTS